MKIKNNKIMVGVKCNCQKPAVPPPPSLLVKVQCKNCGKVLKTNRLNKEGQYICLHCKKGR